MERIRVTGCEQIKNDNVVSFIATTNINAIIANDGRASKTYALPCPDASISHNEVISRIKEQMKSDRFPDEYHQYLDALVDEYNISQEPNWECCDY